MKSLKLSKKGKAFYEIIKDLRLPSYTISKELHEIFLTDKYPFPEEKFTAYAKIRKRYKISYKCKKLRRDILNAYRDIIPSNLIRLDGRIKNNYIKAMGESELSFLITSLVEIENDNEKYFDLLEGMCISFVTKKHYSKKK